VHIAGYTKVVELDPKMPEARLKSQDKDSAHEAIHEASKERAAGSAIPALPHGKTSAEATLPKLSISGDKLKL
jgi:hypothetical protein